MGWSEYQESTTDKLNTNPKKLGIFMENIYNQTYFTDSALYLYMNSFYTGFKFESFAFAENCWNKSALSFDSLYDFNLAMIRRYTWQEPFLQITKTVGNELNDAWYMCYQFSDNFKEKWTSRFDKFKDGNGTYVAEEIYLSFLLNAAGNAIQIKNAVNSMTKAWDEHASETFFANLGNVLRILVIDFENYKAFGKGEGQD